MLSVGASGMGRTGYNEKIKHAVSYVSPGTILPLTVHHGSSLESLSMQIVPAPSSGFHEATSMDPSNSSGVYRSR